MPSVKEKRWLLRYLLRHKMTAYDGIIIGYNLLIYNDCGIDKKNF